MWIHHLKPFCLPRGRLQLGSYTTPYVVCCMCSSHSLTAPRRQFKGYEEVRVPAVRSAGVQPGERVVLIEELEEWAQLPFAGYKCARGAPLLAFLGGLLSWQAVHTATVAVVAVLVS